MPELKKCDLRLLCEKRWPELAPTNDPKVRFCEHCAKGVFALRTRAELSVAAAAGRCVALTNDSEIIGWVGEPEGTWDWMEEESETVKVRSEHPIPADMLNRFNLAFPRASDAALAWPPGTWIVLGTFTPYVARNLQIELREQFPALQINTEHA